MKNNQFYIDEAKIITHLVINLMCLASKLWGFDAFVSCAILNWLSLGLGLLIQKENNIFDDIRIV